MVEKCSPPELLIFETQNASKECLVQMLGRVLQSAVELRLHISELEAALSGIRLGLAKWEQLVAQTKDDHLRLWWTCFGGNVKVIKGLDTQSDAIRRFAVHMHILVRDAMASGSALNLFEKEMESMRGYILDHRADGSPFGEVDVGSISAKLLELLDTVESLR
jgi:hypothetical protein